MSALLSIWKSDLTSVVLFLFVGGLAILAQRRAMRIKYLALSVLLLVLALCCFSPLAVLSEYYLLSAHMCVHVLLLLVAGPLLLLLISKGRWAPIGYAANHPLAAWLAGVATMWFWHVPPVFNFFMGITAHQGAGAFVLKPLQLIEQLSLVGSGCLFASPFIYGSGSSDLMSPPKGVLYLFTACVGCSLLGLLVTFAPAGIYHHYLGGPDERHLDALIAGRWGFTRTADQQIAGLIMWVPCCFVYVAGALFLLIKWFNESERVAGDTQPI
jgi:putative membrane protein